MSRYRDCFFERDSSFRYWGCVGLCAAFAGLAMIGVVGFTASVIDKPFARASFLGVAFGLGWTASMIAIAVWLGYRVMKSPLIRSRIDQRGIVADGCDWLWQEIACVYMEPTAVGTVVCFRQHGTPDGSQQPVQAAAGLSEQEAAELLGELKLYLADRHPHVSVG